MGMDIRRPYILIKDSDGVWSLLLTCRIGEPFNLYGMDMLTMELVSHVVVELFQKFAFAFDMFFVFEGETVCLHDCEYVGCLHDAEWDAMLGSVEKYTYRFSYPRGSHIYKNDTLYTAVKDTCKLLLTIKDAVRL